MNRSGQNVKPVTTAQRSSKAGTGLRPRPAGLQLDFDPPSEVHATVKVSLKERYESFGARITGAALPIVFLVDHGDRSAKGRRYERIAKPTYKVVNR